MLKAISYWSVEGGLEGKCPVAQALQTCRTAGFQALELCIGFDGVLTPETSRQVCAEYRQEAQRQGMAVESLASGMSWGCSPTHDDPAVRRRAIELHKQALQRAAWLGCQDMLFVPGAVIIPWEPAYKPVRYDLAVERAREAVVELGRTAADLGVGLAVENVWNGLFYSPLELAAFIDGIANPAVGVYFDVGNVLNHQQWPPHWITLLGRRIRRIHGKDFKLADGTLAGFGDLLDGDQPWAEVMAALREIGYAKTLTAEMIPYNPGLLERTSAAMDKIMAL